MKEIQLTQGKVALVDDEDFELLNQYKWCAAKNKNTYYAESKINNINVKMHRLIMKTEKGNVVDHKDHNGLNNQKCNVRNCTNAQNSKNRTKSKSQSSSKYIGVIYRGDVSSWQASIRVNYVLINLGFFKTQNEAAEAYNKAAIKYFGEFANLNTILT
jgi:hypothetical protein